MKQKKLLMVAGPVEIEEDISLIGSYPQEYMRTEEYSKKWERIFENLQYIFQTKFPVVCYASSGTGAMEAAVTNFLSFGDTVAFINAGSFGKRWGNIAQKHGINSIEIPTKFGDITEIEDVKSRLREYTDRVNKGESFSMLARLYSDDRGTAINGGEMPFTGRGYLDPAFANVAFNLQDPNKVSKIVESEYGFHIIQLIEKRGDRIKVRHILLKPHVPEEALMAGTARLDSIADDIRNGKFTFEEAASVLSQDKDTRNNHGLLPNPQTNTSKFEMQELPPEIAKVVDKMKVGEISEAFTMIPQKTGKEECVIVKLKSRINGHKATISEDYQNLKEIVLEKRRDEMLDKWIREKQKHTYVRINENWKNCTFKYPGWIKD